MNGPRRGTRACLFCVLVGMLGTGCPGGEARRARLLAGAERTLAAGQVERAASLLRQQLAYAPRDVETATRLAEVLEPADPWGASAVMAGLPGDVPRDAPRARRLLARLELRAGRLEEAGRLLAALERDRLAEPETVHRFLEAVASRGNVEAIETSLPGAWRLEVVSQLVAKGATPEAVAALSRLAPGSGRETLLDALLGALLAGGDVAVLSGHEDLLLDGTPTARKLLVRHRLLLGRDAWGLAAEVEREMERRYPDHPERHAMISAMARRRASQGESHAALALAAEALRLAPESVEALVVKARSLEALGRRDEARRAWRLVAELDPGHAGAAAALAELTPPRPSPSSPVSLRLDVTGPAR